MNNHDLYIQRCLDLAIKAGSSVKSNPHVGAVLVHDNEIIGEGYHMVYGEGHAEVNALKNVHQNKKHLISSSTLYVSLEPCNHQGKTPPCVQAILDHHIKHVVISALDTNPQMRGKSVEILRSKGVNVEVGTLNKQGKSILRRFESNLKGFPSVTLKFAQSKDHYIAKKEERISISGDISNVYVHKLRANHEGILIGTNTAIIDNPSLTTRLFPGPSPLRIVFDRNERLSKSLNVFEDDNETIFITEKKGYNSINKKKITLNTWDWESILKSIYAQGIHSLLIEGGAQVLRSIIKENLWDSAVVITSKELKLNEGVRAPKLNGTLIDQIETDQDIIHSLRPTS